MPSFPFFRPDTTMAGSGIISQQSTHGALMGTTANPASTAWPAANRAIFVPFRVAISLVVYKLVIGAGATASGNFDVGIYDSQGNKLVSSGATAKGASTEQVLDITDTRVGPGLYYLALAADATSNYISMGSTLQMSRLMGIVQMASAYTLPATATFAAMSSAYQPAVAAYTRAL